LKGRCKYSIIFISFIAISIAGCDYIVECDECERTGEIICLDCNGNLTMNKEVDCDNCKSGKVYCNYCDGEGRKECEFCQSSSMSLSPCFKCGGSGIDVTSYRGLPCNVCGGAAMTMQPCHACQGGYIECNYCYGKGSKSCGECEGEGQIVIKENCNECNRSGMITCRKCDGEGEYEEE
jgi:hypothetical protein